MANETLGNFWKETSRKEKLLIYLGIVIVFVLLAITATVAEPHSSNSLARCKSIGLEQSRYSCLYSLALSTENSSLCGSVPTPLSDECYSAIAERALDPSDCMGISNYNITYSCVLWIVNRTDSQQVCNKLNGSFASSCVESLAVKLDNATVCNAITNSSEAGICSSGIYLGDAGLMKNASYCAFVSDTDNQSQVTQEVDLSERITQNETGQPFGFGNLGPVQYVEESGGDYGSKDLCYFSVAAASNNVTSCKAISNGTLQGVCNSYGYQQTAGVNTTQNSTTLADVCNGYSGTGLVSCDALISITDAVTNKNATECARITNTSFEYQCYASMARAYNDTSYCGYIQNSTANQACVEDIYYNVT